MGGIRTRNPRGSVVLRKLKSGNIWLYRWVDENDKHRGVQFAEQNKNFPNVTKAWKEAERLGLPDKYLSLKAKAKEGQKSFGELVNRYKTEALPQRFSTNHSYTSWLNKHILPKWETFKIADVEPALVEDWIKELELAPKSKAHVKGIMTILFNHAMKWKWFPLGRNPMDLVIIKGGARRLSRPQIMTQEQFWKLLDHIQDDYVKVVVIVSMCLGLRFSEVLGIKWLDIDWMAQTMFIRRGIVQGHVGPVKTEYSESPAPLDPSLIAILQSWHGQTEFKEPENWIFASPFMCGKQPYFPTAIRRKIHSAARAAGLTDLFVDEPTKIMRHSYRAWLGNTNTPVGIIKDLMRHADIRTTFNVYGNVLEEPMRAANSKVVGMALKVG